ncbi:MAG: AraC family transcriptional regulator [Pseudopedobacter saltans]|uniref:AraC family transcriptional regulator n=1 Tax=Pseudopedobacter saltans TaxID=151895 RepID=A0A2W5EA28_9SPHI|nr:MAG: AraC family transcriptional regulator [Pseudopedobacter saltans]
MRVEYFDKSTHGKFSVFHHTEDLWGNGIVGGRQTTDNTFVWNKGAAQKVFIDEMEYSFPAASVLPLMANQHFRFEYPDQLVAWQFNRDFYCILNHDEEVGCVGFLFSGIAHPMFIALDETEVNAFQRLENEIASEMEVSDSFQGEMLRSLLKRLIIKSTRLGKSQTESYHLFTEDKLDIVRKFALLVEGNYKTEHEVKYYASILNRSPKTLANFFAQSKQPSPLKIIHNRIILEAKRLLCYTDKSSKEIAFELGFENPEHFSRFFKSNTGRSVSEYRLRLSTKT